MAIAFYLASLVAIVSTLGVVTRTNAAHALLYLIVSFLSVAILLFLLGAPFIAALEIIVYAGAILVLFIFVIMLLNLGHESTERERQWLNGRMWAGPSILAAILLLELAWILTSGEGAFATGSPAAPGGEVGPEAVGAALFGPYLIGVELAALLLLSGAVGAFHLGRRANERGTAS